MGKNKKPADGTRLAAGMDLAAGPQPAAAGPQPAASPPARRGKTRFICMLAAAALAFALGAAATWAVLSAASDQVHNAFQAGQVGCQVDEQFDGTTKTLVAVENTGTTTAYMRVRLVTYWVDADGAPVGVAAPDLNVVAGEGWVLGADGCLYATNPVAPGAATPNLLAAPLNLAEQGSYRQVVDVLAESIQAQPADAVAEAWGVSVVDGQLVPQA